MKHWSVKISEADKIWLANLLDDLEEFPNNHIQLALELAYKKGYQAAQDEKAQ